MGIIWINGSLKNKEEIGISPLDHGIITGDGLFETLISYEGQPFALSRHLKRLKNSAKGMLMDLAPIENTPWREAMISLLEANKLRYARIRITYTTGEADLGSDRGQAEPLVMIAAGPMPKISSEGKLALVPWPRNERGALAGLKTTSYGENVKALAFAKSRQANEALFLNLVGDVCEGTGTNVGWISQGKVFTPALETGCLAGITRGLMIEIAKKLGFEVSECRAPISDLLRADEVFLTSTLREIQWVSSVDDRKWESSSRNFSAKLQEAFRELARSVTDPA